ncbi:MAG: hypothetical protein HQM10_10575 [Candidatus Riflebacteria bacterium]|nr:hypothetical protein [Candidatus Riflebacteria bacterium]
MINSEINLITKETFPILLVKGYFSGDTGAQMEKIVDELLQKNNLFIIIDFSNCKLINSPGVVALMSVTMKVTDDFQGKLCIVGIDELKTSVFVLAGILPQAGTAKNQEEAIQKIKQHPSFAHR